MRSNKNAASSSYYELLDLKPGSSYEEITKAYRHAKKVFSLSNEDFCQNFSKEEIRSLNFLLDEAFEQISLQTLNKERHSPEQPEKKEAPKLYEVTPLTQTNNKDKADAGAEASYAPSNSGSGSFLKEFRLKCGISLDTIYDATKININYLAAIEGESYENLPSDFFVLSYIKQYAEFLGMENPKNIAKKYVKRKSEALSLTP